MGLKTWNNGEKGEVVQAIIEANFKILGRHLNENVLSLSTEERSLLSSDYLSEGLIVYDKDLEVFMQYKNGKWDGISIGGSNSFVYSQDLAVSSWISGEISIPHSLHLVSNPCVQLYILQDGKYESVLGGIYIDNEYNVTLSTDLPFDGKVVIK